MYEYYLKYDIDNYIPFTQRKTEYEKKKIIEALDLEKNYQRNSYIKNIYRSKLHEDGDDNTNSQSEEKRRLSNILYILLDGKDKGLWHKIGHAQQIWKFHSGSVLKIHVIDANSRYFLHKIGNRISNRDAEISYQCFIAKNCWVSCECLKPNEYTLATVQYTPEVQNEDIEYAGGDALTKCYPKYEHLIKRFIPPEEETRIDDTTSEPCGQDEEAKKDASEHEQQHHPPPERESVKEDALKIEIESGYNSPEREDDGRRSQEGSDVVSLF